MGQTNNNGCGCGRGCNWNTVSGAGAPPTTLIHTIYTNTITGDTFLIDGCGVITLFSTVGAAGTFNLTDGTNTQPINSGNTLTVGGKNKIKTTVSATDKLDIEIDTAGATANQRLTFDGTNVVWQSLPPQVQEFASVATLPAAGVLNTLYHNQTDSKLYIWNGTAFVEVSPSPAPVPDIVTTVTNTVAGHKIATYNNEAGTPVDINETVVSLGNPTIVNNIATITLNNENGVAQNVTLDLSQYANANEFTVVATLPATGDSNILYYNQADGQFYVWDGAAFIAVPTIPTLSAQNGLNTTVAPGFVEMGGNLLHDTDVSGDANQFRQTFTDNKQFKVTSKKNPSSTHQATIDTANSTIHLNVSDGTDNSDFHVAAGSQLHIASNGTETATRNFNSTNDTVQFTGTVPGTYQYNAQTLLHTGYPNSRDDTGLTPQLNALYTDASGTVLSAPYTAPVAPTDTSIAANIAYNDYIFSALNDFTRKTVVITNPSPTRSMNVKIDSSWNMGCSKPQSARLAQRIRVNAVIVPAITSITLGGISGGYDVSFDKAGLSPMPADSIGFSDSSYGKSSHVIVLPPLGAATVDLDILLQILVAGNASDVVVQSISLGYIGVTI